MSSEATIRRVVLRHPSGLWQILGTYATPPLPGIGHSLVVPINGEPQRVVVEALRQRYILLGVQAHAAA